MTTNTDAVQRLYVAYFNRPADPTGLTHWEAQLGSAPATQAQLTALAGSGFSGSAEYAALYAGQSNAQIVNNLYNNLFGRLAEPAGLTHWVDRLQAGTETFASIALQLTFSAQGTDATAIANKLSASKAFTTALDTTVEISGYSGMASAASARGWLATVTDPPVTLTNALNGLGAAVAAATGTTGSPLTVVGDLGPVVTFGTQERVNIIEGSSGPDNITGINGIRNIVNAGLGNDTIVGGNLDDLLNGDLGRDIATGGLGNDTFACNSRLATSGVSVGVPLTGFNGVDRITDFNGNGASLGDRILFRSAGAFDQNLNFANVSRGAVTTVTVQNNAPDFNSLLASIENAARGVASTNSLVQFYDVTITAGSGAHNGGTADRVLIFNTGANEINALDTFIGLQLTGVPVVPNDIFFF